MLQPAVQHDAPALPVVGQQGEQRVDFLQGRPSRDRVSVTTQHVRGQTSENDHETKHKNTEMLCYIFRHSTVVTELKIHALISL